jgi:hypothetical protein
MIVGLMVGALFATATAAGIPQYARSLEIVSMRATVADTGPINTNVHVTTFWTPLTEEDRLHSDEAVSKAVDSHVSELVVDSVRLTKSRVNWWAPLGEPLRKDVLDSQSHFQYIERLDDHVEYITGRAPTDNTVEIDGETAIEVAVYHGRAEDLQLAVGDVVHSQPVERGTGNVTAIVTGTFLKAVPNELFWMGFGLLYLNPEVPERVQPLVMFPTRNSMFTAVADANAGLPALYDWFLFTDPVFMADMTIDELKTALDDLTVELEDSLARPFVLTELNSRIRSMEQRALFGSIPLLLMALLIFACVGFFLVLAAGLLARRRINGYMMMQGRGFNIRQQLMIHVIEAAVVSLPAAAVASVVSFAVISALGYLPAYRAITGGSAMPVELSAYAWIWSSGAAIGTATLITVSSSFWDKVTLAASRSSEARPVSAPWFQRYYVDGFLVGLSGILWWELGARTGVVVAEREGEFTPDLSLLAAPVLIIVASSLVALRIFPVVARVVAQVGARSKYPALAFGLASVSRRPFFHGWPMLAFALAISTGIVAGTVVSTLERSTREQVFYSTGADLHVIIPGSTGRLGHEALARIRELDTVDIASPALRASARVGTTSVGTHFTLLGINPVEFQQIAWFRDDFSGSETDMTQLVDRLTVRVLPDAITLPPNTIELSMWAKSEPVIPDHILRIVVKDGIGVTRTFSMSEMQNEWSLVSRETPGAY